MGSDIPDVDPAVLNAAFQALDSHQLVLGPACDGGFYLIGATIAPPEFLQVCTVSMWGAHCHRNAGTPAALGVKHAKCQCAQYIPAACRVSRGAQTKCYTVQWHTLSCWAWTLRLCPRSLGCRILTPHRYATTAA